MWRNLCTSLLYFVVRARCRREESSRSLPHLLMSFLFRVAMYRAIFFLDSIPVIQCPLIIQSNVSCRGLLLFLAIYYIQARIAVIARYVLEKNK